MTWSSQTKYWTAGAVCAMGNSNFLVFPAHCAKHGGLLIFAIPYLFFLIFVAIPLLILLLGLGQIKQNGNVWPDINTKLAGIGYANAYVAFVEMVTYVIIMSWFATYFVLSFNIPWAPYVPDGYTPGPDTVSPVRHFCIIFNFFVLVLLSQHLRG